MTPTDRTRESLLRTVLVGAVVTTAAASIGTTAYLAWEGLDQAATAVATSGAAAATIGGAWAYARPREVAVPVRPTGSHDAVAPDGLNGGNPA
ncbi:hypothetical protein [Streptomyces anulatus]|uniref:hypothetical protein n=1 Tax=Streptomyces anulatus TaxID=1892 RepID=UPI00386D7E42|nr:hypothetical protein OG575_38955 [Streptomyces anulatus]